MMIKNLLGLSEQRLEALRHDQLKVLRWLNELQQQQLDVESRIQLVESQSRLYDQPAIFSYEAFFERQRHKAIVMAEVARHKYQLETLQDECVKQKQFQKLLQHRLRETNDRCEKFREHLKKQRIKQQVRSEAQQQYDIEELSVYASINTRFL